MREAGAGGAPGARAEIPLQLLEESVQERGYPEGLQPLYKIMFMFAALRN